MLASPHLNISCEILLGKQEGFYPCRMQNFLYDFSFEILLSVILELLDMDGFNVLSRCRSFAPGWLGPELLGLQGDIRKAVPQG